MIRINQIKLPIEASEDRLKSKIASIIKTKDYKLERIVKKSLDARNKDNLMYIYAVDISSSDESRILKQNRNNNIMSTNECEYSLKTSASTNVTGRPVVISAGPAGYFCGLYLARIGFKPIIYERGKCVDERTHDVESFWNGGSINPESNVSFGEGGAGTFSDGKLNTGIKDREGRIPAVVKDFISFGAPEDIGYLSKPHIGTDELKKVLAGIRNEIISLGGEIHFKSKLTDIEKSGSTHDITGTAMRLTICDMEINNEYEVYTDALVLAIGHSARDTFSMLNDRKVPMEPKSFAIGLRIEHKREMIDESQYGTSDSAKTLPAADYKMTFRSSEGRSVYSFCMCPGGFVVNASSGENQSVVNGMSNHARNEINSNSAIVVNVTPEDFINEGFESYGVLSGVEFQRKYERLAHDEGKGNIPVQRFGDYTKGRISDGFGDIKPNIRGKYSFGNLNNCLPAYVNNAIIEGINFYDGKLKGFASEDAVLSGIESRTSSPVRIIRDEALMSEFAGIFPCGEGAGYAGGITSAAVDGIKAAEAVALYLNNKFA